MVRAAPSILHCQLKDIAIYILMEYQYLNNGAPTVCKGQWQQPTYFLQTKN